MNQDESKPVGSSSNVNDVDNFGRDSQQKLLDELPNESPAPIIPTMPI